MTRHFYLRRAQLKKSAQLKKFTPLGSTEREELKSSSMSHNADLEAVRAYCKCPSKHSFSGASPDTQQLLKEASQWSLDNGKGLQGLALITSLMSSSPPKEILDPFKLQGQKLCGEDFELYFGDVFGAANNYVYGLYKTREQKDCVGILAKVYPISRYPKVTVTGWKWQTLQALEAEYQKAERAWNLGVGPEVFAVRQCTYEGTEYAIFVMKRWGIGSLTTLVTSGYYAKHKTEINRKIKQLLSKLYMSGFTHGDLHSDNVLFDEDMNLKLIDFERSREITDTDSRRGWYTIEVAGAGTHLVCGEDPSSPSVPLIGDAPGDEEEAERVRCRARRRHRELRASTTSPPRKEHQPPEKVDAPTTYCTVM